MKPLRSLAFATVVLLCALGSASAQSPWQPLTNQPSFSASNPLLLTDGTVMVHDTGAADWWKLTPDQNGSYVNGTWTQLASLPADYVPLYYSSAVLPDGRVIVEGGEYNFLQATWINKGAIYDPRTNTWTSMTPPSGWPRIGDAPSVVLANGTYMQTDCCDQPPKAALLNPTTLTWTATGSNKFDVYDEEGTTLLPGGKVLDVDAYVFAFDPNGMNSELYDPAPGPGQAREAPACNSGIPTDPMKLVPQCCGPMVRSLLPARMARALVTPPFTTAARVSGRLVQISPTTWTSPTVPRRFCPTATC
ncbi:MAG TPA: hypothetical protein VII95_04615 [Terriglobales bacterium]